MRAMQIFHNGQLVADARVNEGGLLYAHVTWTGIELYLAVIKWEADARDQDGQGLPLPDIAEGDVLLVRCRSIRSSAASVEEGVQLPPVAWSLLSQEPEALPGEAEVCCRTLGMSLNGTPVGVAAVVSGDGSLDASVTWDDEEPELHLGALEMWEPQWHEEDQEQVLPRPRIEDVVGIHVLRATAILSSSGAMRIRGLERPRNP